MNAKQVETATPQQLLALIGKMSMVLPSLQIPKNVVQASIDSKRELAKRLALSFLPEANTESFIFEVDSTMSIYQYLTEVDMIHHLGAHELPPPHFAGVRQYEAKLLTVDGWPNMAELTRQIHVHGLKPVTDVFTMLAFAAAYPDEQRKASIFFPRLTIEGWFRKKKCAVLSSYAEGKQMLQFKRPRAARIVTIGLVSE